MPAVELKDDEKAGAASVYFGLLKNKDVLLFFIGIVAYVGTEQALANWMSEFLRSYHQADPNKEGAQAVAWFWGLMSLGCLLGLALLKLWDSKVVLKAATLIAMVVLSLALFGNKEMALYAFPAAGFFISVMFSIIFSLALNSVTQHHGSFSGILCSGIFGGALVPLIIGSLGDWIGLRFALMFLYITLAYILFLAYYARPIVNNKTISLKQLLRGK
ncbi:L-fucose transporter [compost metagenome]